MTREEQKEQRRQQILWAGLDLFVKKGYSATQISDIAKQVNMSTGLMFHYFPSKEALYVELARMGLQGTQMVQPSYSGDNPLSFFEKFLGMLFFNMKEQPQISKIFVFMAQTIRSEGVPKEAKELACSVDSIEQSAGLIEAGQALGVIREGNPLSLSNLFWCSVQGVCEQYALHPEIELPQPEWIIDILRRR